jgi:DNA-binding transcriptional LysR family regulator
LVEDDVGAGRLRRLLPGWRNGPSYTYAFHRVELRGSTRVRALIDALRGERTPAETAPPRGRLSAAR